MHVNTSPFYYDFKVCQKVVACHWITFLAVGGRLPTAVDAIISAGLGKKGHEFFQSLHKKNLLIIASSWCCWLELIQKDRGFKWLPLSTSCHSLFSLQPARQSCCVVCLFSVFVQLHCNSRLPLCLQLGNCMQKLEQKQQLEGIFTLPFWLLKKMWLACCQAQPKWKQNTRFWPEIVSYVLRSGTLQYL